ncbi:hypothetical protein [Paludibacterium paludis]|uniref:Uncharacterized protein n=1 Tax=Paludibacterium paludis TaxID=1225769 RepID=A0A918U905_9NEIS|nr:hypothetical protein [Paludibacterium paludis]GGY09726.1 hypothetical protein GCM10011289_10750 [Paludibacterium paludis]
MAICFFLSGEWLMLPVAFFIAFFATILADREQLAEMDASTAAMLLEGRQRPVFPAELFRGRELLFYRAGCPIYRYLVARDGLWQLLGEDGKVRQEDGMIRVFPGYVYQRVERPSAK